MIEAGQLEESQAISRASKALLQSFAALNGQVPPLHRLNLVSFR
jgi:hypothetical protein